MQINNEYKNKIFEIIEHAIRNVYIDNSNIYDVCLDTEKLKLSENKNQNLTFKVLKNAILLRYCFLKQNTDYIELKYFDETIQTLKQKYENLKTDSNNLYVRIPINSFNDIENISYEIGETFKLLFIKYVNTESFGCCSKYIECSDNHRCVHDNVRFKFACLYRKNLDNNKIFYGKNKNI